MWWGLPVCGRGTGVPRSGQNYYQSNVNSITDIIILPGDNLYHQDTQRDVRHFSSKELQSEHQACTIISPSQQMLQSSKTLLSQNIRTKAGQETNHDEMVY